MYGKYTIYCISLAFLIILLSSCAGSNKDVVITEESLRTGTDALVMSFYPNNPPNETYESDSNVDTEGVFQVALTLLNKGAADITNGKVIVSYDDTYLKMLSSPWVKYNQPLSDVGNSFRMSLLGKSVNNPEGDSFVYSKKFKTKNLSGESQSHDASFIATACYDYETKKGVPICIDPKQFEKTQKACQMKPITMSSQGAPLVVTKVEPKIFQQGNSYEFEVSISLQNKGKGQIYKKGFTDIVCGGDFPEYSARDKILNVIEEKDVDLRLSTDETVGQFKCSPFPIMLYTDQESSLRCVYTKPITNPEAFSTLLFVDIGYGYTHSIAAKTKIMRKIQIR